MRSAAAVVLILFSAGVLAHPGHGVVDLWHLLTEPDHLALLLLPLVLAVKWGRTSFKRRRRETRRIRRPSRG
jgi:hypothetical protein